MAVFSGVEADLLQLEGSEISNDPNDYGGLTKYGISKKENPSVDVANLTWERALNWYQLNYWNNYHLSDINSQKIANKMFIALINMNPHEAITCMQKAINFCSSLDTVDVDGDLGVQTIDAINNSSSQGWLHDRFAIELIFLYISKVEADKSQINFLVSWDSRAVAD